MPAGATIPALDATTIAYWRRLANWLGRRTPFVWIGERTIGKFMSSATPFGLPALHMCPGPICAGRSRHAPPLSWFGIPTELARHGELPAAIQKVLDKDRDAPNDARIPALIQRILATNALHLRRRIADLPTTWYEGDEAPRVVLIDERDTSYTDICTPRRSRRPAFAAMVKAAGSAYPEAPLWILRSADAGSGRWLSARTALPPTARFLNAAHSLAEILEQADAIYTVGASEGMAGLLAEIPVYTFGSPYYAGWGLTSDYVEMPERTAQPTLTNFFNATFLQLATYLDPCSNEIGTLDSVLDSIELQHSVAIRYSDLNQVACVGFQWWKRKYAAPYLTAGGGTLRWTSRASNAHQGEYAAIWGGRSTHGLDRDIRHVRIEDGFLHSAGLGSDMSPPCSQVIDRRGIYFDACRPSDLTIILNTTTFDNAELKRAAALRKEIVRLGLTKYNLGRRAPMWSAPKGRRIALVAGQVADDASIRLGTGTLSTSEDLLREVRAQHPDAYIVYKPHPDVLSGNRTGLIDAAHLADVIDTSADLISLIEVTDELHTLSSLAGFDALIREKPVFTYGLPFYSGWGLTHDALPQPWRERSLSLDMLTAGVLLRYPLYWDWQLSLFTTPEAIVRQLAEAAARPLDKIHGNFARPFIKGWRWSRNAISHAADHGKRLITKDDAKSVS
ncbi:capsular biosynthesis protein [Burkholderia cepacia]|nr:capsular biosynthesis protein [Burkholderia cepacia]